MGFELILTAHERLEEGGYDKENTREIKKRVGDPFEDIPLEKLAGVIMAQLARRDVWVVGVKVAELSRKEITFKETKGGIVLKNKKFLFGEGEAITVVEANEAPAPPQHQPHNQGGPKSSAPVKFVVYAPEPQHEFEAKKKGLKFTVDQRYPVFEVKPGILPGDEVYRMRDDLGREINVADKYFVPEQSLFADRELGFSKNNNGPKLDWGGAVDDTSMPALR